MPSKRGIPKKYNYAKCFTSPRKIDKRGRRQRAAQVSRKNERVGGGYGRVDKVQVNDRLTIATQRARENVALRRESKANALAAKATNQVAEQKATQASKTKIRVEQSGKENKAQVPKQAAKQTGIKTTPDVPPRSPVAHAQEQKVRVFALGHFHQLLQVCAAGSLVVLDIDETMIITRNMPSLLLESAGITAFQKHVNQVFPDFHSRNLQCRSLQAAIKDKTLVEEQTSYVIQELQKRQCRVFALTARYSELAERTERVLGNLGISFKDSAPFPESPIQDPITEAVVMNGIVYCNGQDKGRILSRLLQSVIFPREAKAAHQDRPPIPGIYFVDDRIEHTLAVRNSLQSFGLDIPSICFHYRSPTSLLSDSQRSLATSRPDLLPFIMSHFIDHDTVLSNSAALALLDSEVSSGQDVVTTTAVDDNTLAHTAHPAPARAIATPS